MSRELDINIVVNDGGAKDQLAAVDAAADRTGASVAALAAPISDFEARMQKAAVASGMTAQQLAAVRAQLQAGIDPKAIDTASASLSNMQKAATDAGSGLNKVKQAADDATGADGNSGFGGLDRMATRIVERMAILYALRGAFQFVEGVIEGSRQMVQLSVATGLSTVSLQELSYASTQVDVSFTSVVSAADTLEKKLGEGDSSLKRALNDIGLSFEDLRRRSPDDALKATITALAGVSDQFRRTGDEAQIFGTDKIDGLITQFGRLKDEAHDTDIILTDQQLKAIDDVGKAWDRATASVKAYGAEAIAAIINAGRGKAQDGVSPSNTAAPLIGGGLLAGGVGGVALATSAGLTGGFSLALAALIGGLTGASVGIGTQGLREKYLPYQSEVDASVPQSPGAPSLLNPKFPGATALSVSDPETKAKAIAAEHELNAEIERRIVLEKEAAKAAALQTDMDFKTQMQLLKMIGDYNKAQEKRLELTNAFVAANVEASDKLAARSGVDVNGRSLTTDPFDAANQKYARQIETIRRNAPEGFDTKPQEDEAAAELQDAFDALRKSAMGLGDAQDKAGAAATAAGRATAASAPSVMTLGSSALDAAASFATAGATVNPAGGARRKTPDEIAALGPLGNGLLQYAQSGIATSISTVGIDPRALRGYRSGTNGYEDFGSGTPVMLHGWEKVTPQSGEGGSGAVTIGDIHIHGNVQSQAMASRMVDDIASEVYRRISMRGGKQQLTR